MPILKRISELQIFELGGRVPKYVIMNIPGLLRRVHLNKSSCQSILIGKMRLGIPKK